MNVRIAPEADWGGTFPVVTILRKWKDGKVDILVKFHERLKRFHVHMEDINMEGEGTWMPTNGSA